MNASGSIQARVVRDIRGHSDLRAAPAEFPTPWWLWWNILSIDAPTVAVVWALLFAHASHVPLHVSDVIALALVVWVIYVSDRLLDGRTTHGFAVLQERHFFCARHRVALVFGIVLGVAGVLWVAAEHLTPGEAIAGLKLGAIVAAYIAGIHAAHGFVARFVPKEIAVGALFAAGTTLPMWSQDRGFYWDLWTSVILFALLCSLNCLSIECWENDRPNASLATAPPLVAWVNSRIDRIALGLATFALVMLCIRPTKGSTSPELFTVSMSALLILLLNRRRHRLSRNALRVLADAALVLPALLALVIRI